MSIQGIDLFKQMFLNSLSNFEKSLLGFKGESHTVDILALFGVNAIISEAEGNGMVMPAPELTPSLFDFQKI